MTDPEPQPRKTAPHAMALGLLAIATLVVAWPLGMTNRVLAGIDALTYFTPYWAFRMAEMRAGRIPLWNPYIFTGAPFLANIQSAVLYPPNWLFMWLSPERALICSALLHLWLAAAFTYVFARRSLHQEPPAAWLAGLIYGLSGFALARVENINQLNALAWLPALLWLLDEAASASNRRLRGRWCAALALVIALQLLAGHTQTAFVNMAALVLWALAPALVNALMRRPVMIVRRLMPLVAAVPGFLLAAAQILPTAELSALSWRTGGLSYRQTVSFSLRPQQLFASLLPPFAGGLGETFGSEGFGEFVGYVGISGMALGLVALMRLSRSSTGTQTSVENTERTGGANRAPPPPCGRGLPRRRVRQAGPSAPPTQFALTVSLAFLAACGLFLAFGAYNPFYYLLWRFVPGFAFFRAPVRWLGLYAIGMAGLAGMGMDVWSKNGSGEAGRSFPWGALRCIRSASRRQKLIIAIVSVAGALAVALLMAIQSWPRWQTIVGWALAAVVMLLLLCWLNTRPHLATLVLPAVVMAELVLASRSMPFTLATAPSALALRNGPAAILAATGSQASAARDRFLSLSDIGYDPGDLAELQAQQRQMLSPEAIDRLVRASKQMEVIAPNLSMLVGLPAADGYDGGLLPTADYAGLTRLMLPTDSQLLDGRLREQLQSVPSSRLLDLLGVRYVLTDKQNDLWLDDIYYDLEQAATIRPGESLRLDLTGYPPFSATSLGVISHLDADRPVGSTVAKFVVTNTDGSVFTLPVRAGFGTAWYAQADSQARIARAWPDWAGQGSDYVARLTLPHPSTLTSIAVSVPEDAHASFVLRGMSLIDDRTGTHTSVTVSPAADFRRIFSGDVKVYERAGAPGRAWLVHGVDPVQSRIEALDRLADPTFNPRTSVVVESAAPRRSPGPATPEETVVISTAEADHLVLSASVSRPAVLVLEDAYYPGWVATVDGAPVPISRANAMFRAVFLEPGRHIVEFRYRPSSWRWGVAISAITGLGIVVALARTLMPLGRRRPLRSQADAMV